MNKNHLPLGDNSFLALEYSRVPVHRMPYLPHHRNQHMTAVGQSEDSNFPKTVIQSQGGHMVQIGTVGVLW